MRARGWILFVVLAGAARGDDRDHIRWLADLCDGGQVADNAYDRLVAAGPDAFGRVLEALLGDNPRNARVRCASLLGRYAEDMPSTEPFAKDLRKLLSEKDPDLLVPLRPVFAKAGLPHLKPLERLFASPDAATRARAAQGLGDAGTEAFPLIRKNLESSSKYRREAALLALAAAGSTAAAFTADVLALLSDREAEVRAAAARACEAVTPDPGKAVRALLPLVDDPDPVVVEAATAAIRPLSITRFGELVAALDAARGRRRELLVELVRSLPGEASGPYAAALLASSTPVRAALLEAWPPLVLPHLGADARERIAGWAAEAGSPLRPAALTGLASAAWPDRDGALAVLRSAASDPDPAIRAAAVRGLGLLDPDPTPLRNACADADPTVRLEAAFALWRRGESGPDSLRLCLDLLRSTPAAAERIGEMGAGGLVALDELVRLAETGSRELARAARSTVERLLDAPCADAVVLRPAALAKAPPELRARCEKALAWLAEAQEADGHWSGARFEGPPGCDVGLTALAVLSLLSGGNTDRSGAHEATVRKGVAFLVGQQRENGWIGDPAQRTGFLQHGVATAALCECACTSPDRDLRAAAGMALRVVIEGRNPERGWRYVPRGGDNDTFVTAWMLMAVQAGKMAGFEVDRAVYDGALLWVDKMTDPNFGDVGYEFPGGLPACPKEPGSLESIVPRALEDIRGLRHPEKTQSCTAAGVWIRVIAQPEWHAKDVANKGWDLIQELKPRWNVKGQTIDLCYWHWGALVAAQWPEDPGGWRARLEEVLFEHQALNASWDPVGVWGRGAGRVFSTSMATLALLAPYAYPRGCFEPDYRRRLHPAAYRLVGR